jgi:TonB-dependent SusC/RagA subfamily outer membrane receptor
MKKHVSFFAPPIFILFLVSGCRSTRPDSEPEAAANSETVSVGYGEVDKDDVSGAVSTVDGNVAQDVQAQSVEEMLRGRASGVEVSTLPGGGIRVKIRGSRSFMGGSDPLYVVDNMPMSTSDGALYGVNPYDIESITVLKDAASTSIYGSRGANGVILIKTKGTKR